MSSNLPYYLTGGQPRPTGAFLPVSNDFTRPHLHQHDKVERCGPYRLRKKIGTGNFATVRLAKHEMVKTKVAVKIIDKHRLDGASLNKVYREVKILKSLNHPHIIKLYQVMESDRMIYVVTEYASGGELFDRIISHGRLMESEARHIFRQVTAAVAYCHCRGVVHRDLKAENLLLDDKMNIKLIDFGFSNFYTSDSLLSTWCGSPPYAAPELFVGVDYDGTKVDVWSLGVVLYILVCGGFPFPGTSVEELKSSVLVGQVKIPFWVSVECADLIRRVLVVNPLKRYTMQQIMQHKWFVCASDYSESVQNVMKYSLSATDEDEAPNLLGTDGQLNQSVLTFMQQKANWTPDQIAQAVTEQHFDDVAAVYNLLVDKLAAMKVHSGGRQNSNACAGASNRVLSVSQSATNLLPRIPQENMLRRGSRGSISTGFVAAPVANASTTELSTTSHMDANNLHSSRSDLARLSLATRSYEHLLSSGDESSDNDSGTESDAGSSLRLRIPGAYVNPYPAQAQLSGPVRNQPARGSRLRHGSGKLAPSTVGPLMLRRHTLGPAAMAVAPYYIPSVAAGSGGAAGGNVVPVSAPFVPVSNTAGISCFAGTVTVGGVPSAAGGCGGTAARISARQQQQQMLSAPKLLQHRTTMAALGVGRQSLADGLPSSNPTHQAAVPYPLQFYTRNLAMTSVLGGLLPAPITGLTGQLQMALGERVSTNRRASDGGIFVTSANLLFGSAGAAAAAAVGSNRPSSPPTSAQIGGSLRPSSSQEDVVGQSQNNDGDQIRVTMPSLIASLTQQLTFQQQQQQHQHQQHQQQHQHHHQQQQQQQHLDTEPTPSTTSNIPLLELPVEEAGAAYLASFGNRKRRTFDWGTFGGESAMAGGGPTSPSAVSATATCFPWQSTATAGGGARSRHLTANMFAHRPSLTTGKGGLRRASSPMQPSPNQLLHLESLYKDRSACVKDLDDLSPGCSLTTNADSTATTTSSVVNQFFSLSVSPCDEFETSNNSGGNAPQLSPQVRFDSDGKLGVMTSSAPSVIVAPADSDSMVSTDDHMQQCGTPPPTIMLSKLGSIAEVNIQVNDGDDINMMCDERETPPGESIVDDGLYLNTSGKATGRDSSRRS